MLDSCLFVMAVNGVDLIIFFSLVVADARQYIADAAIVIARVRVYRASHHFYAHEVRQTLRIGHCVFSDAIENLLLSNGIWRRNWWRCGTQSCGWRTCREGIVRGRRRRICRVLRRWLKRCGLVPQLLQGLNSLWASTLRFQIQNGLIADFFGELHLLPEVRGDLFVTLLFQSELRSHELDHLRDIHLHLGLQCQCETKHKHTETGLHISMMTHAPRPALQSVGGYVFCAFSSCTVTVPIGNPICSRNWMGTRSESSLIHMSRRPFRLYSTPSNRNT